MEQGTKGGRKLRGAGNKGRGEVEWSREQRGGRLSGAGNKGGMGWRW